MIILIISNQTALVTGANRGFGKELALELLNRGAKVYGGARDPGSINTPGVIPIQLDITKPDSISAAVEKAGDVTLLINNAGILTKSSLLTGNLDDIHLEFNTHVFGTLSMIRAFSPIIENNGGGTILNVLSILSWYGSSESGGYSAAKAAEWGITNALRLSLQPHQIRVVGLHVGYMETDLITHISAAKSSPKDIAKITIDGIESDLYEIVADEMTRIVQSKLSGGVPSLYSQLF